MTRVAANTVTDHYRRLASERRAMTAYATDVATSTATEAAKGTNSSISGELPQCMLPIIEQRSEPYREALTWVVIEDLSQKAAAARAGLSVSGIKSRVQRARHKLRDAIVRCCAHQLDPKAAVELGCSEQCRCLESCQFQQISG